MSEAPQVAALDDAPEGDEGAGLEEPELRLVVVPEALHGQRLDKALVSVAAEFSRNHLQSLVEQGHVQIDAVVCTTPSRKVRAGQRLQVELVAGAESRAFRPESIAIDVVHEDADLLVINKRAGWVVHPAAGNWSGTLLNQPTIGHDSKRQPA